MRPVKASGVQRSSDARGDCLIGCPLPNSSIVHWRIDGGHCYWIHSTLFVTSQHDVIFTFAN